MLPAGMIRMPWQPGPDAGATGRVVVSATRFVYRRFAYLPMVSVHGERLARTWRRRPGAVGVLRAGEPSKKTTYSLSVWTSEEALREFLRAPEHVALMRRYRGRLVSSRSVTWETDRFELEPAWAAALERLSD